ncbi:MAG: DPP IV N-terminal domain-containing protein [Chloroflexota bacterium]|nr:DPP IV N-terminal domain-containing protein [Chloroflexota bacterium]MDE2946544.1 DPP IV N-terminal domain-containing protein [Chloroflexota bacterium]
MFRIILRLSVMSLPASLGFVLLASALAPQLAAGEQAVFVARVSGQLQLTIADLSRGLRAALPQAGGDVFQPSISPHSGELAFASRSGGDAELYLLRLGDGAPRQLTDNSFDDLSPEWSPAGDAIVYQANPRGVHQFFLIDADGGDPRQLSFNETDYNRPSWSPDGSALVFDAGGDIFIYDIASGASQALTRDEYWDAQAAWSPDGGTIVYDSFRDGSWNLVQLDLASGRASPLTPAGRDEQGATFTNQPGQIAYQSVTKFPGLLFLLDLDRPSAMRALSIPPESGSPLHMLFGNAKALTLEGIDVLEPDWLRNR